MPIFSTLPPDTFDDKIQILNSTDSNSNVNFNNIFQKIINNEAYLLSHIEQLTSKVNQLTVENATLKNRTVREAMKAQGLIRTIEIAGSADTYYPVAVTMGSTENYRAVRLGLGKHLGSKTANYAGNHSNGTSSCSYEWLLSAGGWDGNCRFLRTLYGAYGYAPLLSHIEMPGGSFTGIVLWLRGGGTSYVLSCDDTINSLNIYYSRTNLTSYDANSSYAYFVEPRNAIGNGGLGTYGTMSINGIIP